MLGRPKILQSIYERALIILIIGKGRRYLTRRYNAARDWRMNSRDGRGRLLQATTYSGFQTARTETLSLQGDGRISAYTAARADFTNYRTYTYAPLSQYLTRETLYLGASQGSYGNVLGNTLNGLFRANSSESAVSSAYQTLIGANRRAFSALVSTILSEKIGLPMGEAIANNAFEHFSQESERTISSPLDSSREGSSYVPQYSVTLGKKPGN